MINDILILYAFATAPLIAWAFWKAAKKRREAAIAKTPLEEKLKEAFDKMGLKAEFHELPGTPEETTMQQSSKIIERLRDADARREVWFEHIRKILNDGKRDTDAMMQALQAISKALVGAMDSKQEPDGRASHFRFINELEYVRDTFAESATQKKAIEAVINSIKTKHGAGK